MHLLSCPENIKYVNITSYGKVSGGWNNFRECNSLKKRLRQWLSKAWLRLSWCHNTPFLYIPCTLSTNTFLAFRKCQAVDKKDKRDTILCGMELKTRGLRKNILGGLSCKKITSTSYFLCIQSFEVICSNIPCASEVLRLLIRKNVGKKTDTVVSPGIEMLISDFDWLLKPGNL